MSRKSHGNVDERCGHPTFHIFNSSNEASGQARERRQSSGLQDYCIESAVVDERSVLPHEDGQSFNRVVPQPTITMPDSDDTDLDPIFHSPPQCRYQVLNQDAMHDDCRSDHVFDKVHDDMATCSISTTTSLKSCTAQVYKNDGSFLGQECKIMALPDDVFFLIFSFLQPKELSIACCTCRRFQLLASKDSVWIPHARKSAVVRVPRSSESRLFSLKELCRVAPNWKHGRFKENFAVKHRTRLIPWVQKCDDGLWFSTCNSIRRFKAQPSGHLKEEKDRCLHGMEEDVTRFLQKNDIVISGCRNGSVYGWESSGNPLFCYKQVHSSDTHCVDFTDTIIISGSRDTTCKILPLYAAPDQDTLVARIFNAGERVWSLKISPCERFFAAGLAGCLDYPPVVMWDIESGQCIGQLSMNHRRGAGVFDLKFESEFEMLACGYDTFVRMWDLRTQTCVAQWEEPYDSALYCIETDGANSFFVGTARHGMVRLWDKRMTKPVQAYYSTNRNSPVYSLALDYGHLYLALDMGLNVMDFTPRKTDPQAVGPSSSSQHSSSTNRSRPRHSYRR